MGFTHYWKHRKIGIESWNKIVRDTKKLFKILPEHSHSSGDYYGDVPLKIQYEYDKARPPVANIDEIRFNGVGDMGHETLYIERIPHDYDGKRVKGRWMGFCKTARKPYDLAVQVVLLIVKHHVGKTFDLSSDGDDEDWSEALSFTAKEYGYGFQSPLFKTDQMPN